MLPKKYEPMVFGFLLSGMMSLLVSGVSTLNAAGLGIDFVALWMRAWLTAWLIAFPVVLFVAPLTRRLVMRLVRQ